MKQELAWPARLQPQEDGAILVSFPAIPEAITEAETQAEGIGSTVLAACLGVSEGTARRLFDLDRRSHIGQIETARRALGQRLRAATDAAL